ncbi:MAG TPA: hypothetical protein VGM05_30815 [Planctomycetaceae bacterium]|jgi:hypothetical protein
MRLGWNNLGDETIRQAEIIDAIDPDTNESFQLWGQESPGTGVQPGHPAHKVELLDVLIKLENIRTLADRVRTVKGRLPDVVEKRLAAM